MILTVMALCIATVLTVPTQDKISSSSALFENAFLSADFDQNNLVELLSSDAINCFPPEDRRHKYEWAGGFNQKHFLDELNSSDNSVDMDSSYIDETPKKKRLDKKNDKNVESDSYAQYPTSCACQTKYELLDLGYTHFPRYIVNAICQNRNINSRKCWRGLRCKEIPYKVRVLTKRSESESNDPDHHSTLLPEPLRDFWRFKTVTIAAACQCSV
ncbi:uncharacterized protein LOC131676475 [Topomyia yanbarensis]|uniref:uncharacterized protein LOC131676475 n=1 Tax=Topomyia yanbarensis TaxID=2498891 RepID=UPI00273CEB73|nr:uncharacterized protein LOC131676475 [Topomyia yanbarensis]